MFPLIPNVNSNRSGCLNLQKLFFTTIYSIFLKTLPVKRETANLYMHFPKSEVTTCRR